VFVSRSTPKPKPDARPEADERPATDGTPQPSRDWPIIACIVIVLFFVTCSTVIVDAADWIYRSFPEVEPG
jgi:hypothetical protein